MVPGGGGLAACLLVLALVAWLLGAGCVLFGLRPRTWRLAAGFAAAGLAVHALALSRLARAGELLGTVHGLLLLAAGVAALAYLVVGRRSGGRALRGLLLPTAAVLLAAGTALPEPSVALRAPVAGRTWLILHVGLHVLGLLLAAVAAGVSALYLVVRRRLKRKRLAGLAHLPSLDALDRLNVRFLAASFAALTLGIALGGIWGAAADRPVGLADPTVWGTTLAWVFYGLVVQVRVVGGWRGRWTAMSGLAGFAMLAAGALAVNLLGAGFHG